MLATDTELLDPRPGPAETPPAATAETPRPTGWPFRLGVLGMLTISFNATRLGGYAVSDLLFLLSAFIIWLKIIAKDTGDLAPAPGRRSTRLILIGTLIMLTSGTVSALLAPAPLTSMLVMARFAWVTILWFWTLRAITRTRADLQRLVGAWQLGLVLSAVAATLGSVGVPMFATTTSNQNRQDAFTFHPNELMNFLITGLSVALAVAVMLPVQKRSRRAFQWAVITAAVLSYGLFTTGATSGVVAMAGSVVAMVGVASVARLLARHRPRPRRRGRSPLTIMVGAAAVLVGVMVLWSADLPVTERLGQLGSGDGGINASVETRERANEDILGHLDHYLLTGVGPNLLSGTVAAGSTEETHINVHGDQHNGVHNMWLKMVYEEGIPALVGLWLILATAARQCYLLVLRTWGTDLHPLAVGLFGGLVAATISSMFSPTAFSRHYWLPIALIGVLWEVRRRELKAEAAATVDSVRALPAGRGARKPEA